MGTIFYGDARYAIQVEDRALAHIKSVIIARLRRGESCTFSWHPEGQEHRETIWIAQFIPLNFVFDTGDRPKLNRKWLELMSQAASNPAGLYEMPEPPDDGTE